MGKLVDFVQIGTFLPVNFYVHKQGIHLFRSNPILERLMGHHMAPVASGIADGEQNRLVLTTCQFQRALVPRMPSNRIMGMLQQIGACFFGQMVGRIVVLHGAISPRPITHRLPRLSQSHRRHSAPWRASTENCGDCFPALPCSRHERTWERQKRQRHLSKG